MIRPPAHAFLIAVLLIAAAGLVPAPSEAADPCAADIERFCPGVEPGNGRLSSCLGEEHVDQISEHCRKHLKRTFLRTQLFDVEDACLEAAQRLCFDAVLLGADFEACLSERAGELPEACREAIGR